MWTAEAKQFVRFGQCQIAVSLSATDRGLYIASEPGVLAADVTACVATATREDVDVLIMPELALAFPESDRSALLKKLEKVAIDEKMLIIAGSYYDASRANRLLAIGPGFVELGYKVQPSRYEVSALAGRGMTSKNEILLLESPYGRLIVITCVDLISDEVQFAIRRLATQGRIDMVVNINHNPAAWEFLVEANGLARRHPIFASVTNVSGGPSWSSSSCEVKGQRLDKWGRCYGHTAVFADLRKDNQPASRLEVLPHLPPQFVLQYADGSASPRVAYDKLVGDVGAFREGMLVYEANMFLKRTPAETNAPDQGYPTIRGIRVVDLERPSTE